MKDHEDAQSSNFGSVSKVRLPVLFQGTDILQSDGTPLPRIKNQARGILIINPADIEDELLSEAFGEERMVTIRNKDQSLFAQVRSEPIAELYTQFRITEWAAGSSANFVEMKLTQPLVLRISLAGLGKLENCPCRVSAFPDRIFDSVNEAYTTISQEFEPTRRSHAGNVFKKVYCRFNGRLRPLEVVRKDVVDRMIKGQSLEDSDFCSEYSMDQFG